eukprot:Gb_06198 [translate_table: standard]
MGGGDPFSTDEMGEEGSAATLVLNLDDMGLTMEGRNSLLPDGTIPATDSASCNFSTVITREENDSITGEIGEGMSSASQIFTQEDTITEPGEGMSSAPQIFTQEDTVWVEDEQIMIKPLSLAPDYVCVHHEAIEEASEKILAAVDTPEDITVRNEAPQADDQGFITSASIQVDLLPQNALQECANQKPLLFQVMRIVSDKQDMSFVEKVHIPEDQILSLCNRIVPNAAETVCHSQQIRIDFTALDKQSLQAIGFYGDKQMMARIFKDMGIIDDSILTQMEEERFEPGLYVGLLKELIVVFYWHQGAHLKNASRKDVSCNFIRYVVDLCDNVYACIGEYNLFQALAASAASACHKRRRTQKLKISHVQNSENDVKISPGFSVNILTRGMEIISMPEGAAKPKHSLFFTEGYHRFAFVSASYKKPQSYVKTYSKKVKADALLSEIEVWSKDYDLDFNRLSNEDLVCLLTHSQLPEYQAYSDMMNSFSNWHADQRSCNVQSAVNTEEETMLKIFLAVLPEYCGLIRYLSDSASAEREDDNAIQKIHSNLNGFEQLQQYLDTIWDGNPGEHKLLFVGSEIKFLHKNWINYNCIIERPVKSSAPISYGEELFLEHTVGDSKVEKVTFIPLSKDSSAKKGLVLSGKQLILQCRNPRKSLEGVIETCNVPNHLLREWLEPLVPKKLLKLAINIVFLAFLTSNGILQLMKSFGDALKVKLLATEREFIEKQLLLAFLLSDDDLDQVKSLNANDLEKFLTNASLDVIISEIESVKPEISPDLLDLYICASICKDGQEEFRENALAMMRKDLLPLLHKKLECEKVEATKLREQHFKEEEEKFLYETKKKLSQSTGMQRHMYVERCFVESHGLSGCVKNAYRYVGRSIGIVKSPELSLKISSEEEEKPCVQWKISELVPTKKDLDELDLNAMHGITPLCSEMYELVCCDPDNEELRKVVLLRSGELLVFIQDKQQQSLHIYFSIKRGSLLRGSYPIFIARRGFDLVAFDESTRFLALYDCQLSKIGIFRFDQSFRHVDWTGIDVMLDVFSGSTNITWMQLIPGKAEILLADDTNRLRVVEVHEQPLMKPKHISLSLDLLKACISGDGSFLFAFQKATLNLDSSEEHSPTSAQHSHLTSGVELEVYMLCDNMSYLKNIHLDINVEDIEGLQVKVVYFGSQIHLVVYSDVVPGAISSTMLNIVSATEVLEFQELGKRKSGLDKDDRDTIAQDCQKTCATLDYIYHIFDKFAVSPALSRELIRDLNFHVLLKSRENLGDSLDERKCEEYLKLLIGRLEQEKGKDFSALMIKFHVHNSECWELNSMDSLLTSHQRKPMGNWIRQLICLVPIQITRAENNGVIPLIDGLQIPPYLNYVDSISLANLMRFGFYDAILNHWDGKIKVISSMGKQSSGKSYLLNHLSGSLLDVAGGRCTDGVWMTIRLIDGFLYVILDFEGLGSFERTEQEDMLLSVLNASLSNLTIFNKKDFHLDKETEAVFNRFQNGVSLVKHDDKLFKGLFYIAIKDVDSSDVDDLKTEFHAKLLQICKKSRENFITKMYGGMVELAALPPFTRREYHQESLPDIALTVKEELDHSFESGRAFLRDLKLVIAQIAAKDWTPVDLKRVAMKVDILRRNLDSAIRAGCLSVTGLNKVLMNFDTQEEIIDAPIKLGDLFIDLKDTALELVTLDESMGIDKILSGLRSRLENVLERKGGNGDLWHSNFERFLLALADRRCVRVQQWLSCNTAEFSGSNNVQKLQLEASAALAELKQGLSVCGCKCSVCFWRCVLEKGHSSSHSCMGNHVCTEKCTYCSLEIGHEGLHKCNSPQHLCKMKCSLASCKNLCVMSIECGEHEKHACHERYCTSQCIMDGCMRTCGYQDHFHGLMSSEHLCGNEHACRNKCEAAGICEILTELVRQTRSFQGRRGSFEYDHVSEQNGLHKDCCIAIPPFKQFHDGLHVHTQNPDAVHYCMVRCEACGYFCQRPMFHAGLHHTVHGNMRNVRFTSDREEFDIQDRKYTWGESGLAEMCNMHCKAQGRGHVHLIRCPGYEKLTCTSHMYDGSRHETRKYGPDVDVPKDELTHETYWKRMRFEDPCSEEDQKEFSLCNHICKSEEHNEIDGTSSKSYCTEKLWHTPLKRSNLIVPSAGYITDDGHIFACEHSKNAPHHVVFVIDKSGSMCSSDIKPTMSKFVAGNNCRLGCVYEAIVRFIRRRLRTPCYDSLSVVLFDNTAILALEMQEIKESVVDSLVIYTADGGTSYSYGLKLAEEVIVRGSKDPNVGKKKPTVIFLSDGGNNDGTDPMYYVNRMKQVEPRMIMHTIMFGTDPNMEILKKMGEVGNGSFQHSLDELQLAQSFEHLATSLEPAVAALI